VLTLPVSSPAPARPRQQARAFLPEVQALRAVAVLLVVLYHFWPERLPGGFVGVDVFFVISGFLITSHLHREVRTRGRIALGQFYARRARRLLPASLLVLVVSAAATLVFLPATRWASTAGEVLASGLYVQNWVLAGRAVDYSASQTAASTVQHFWSLSVEEQFYLLWPPLILGLLFLARRMASGRRDVVLLGGILVVSAASLAWSVYATATDQAAAYFTTPTRIWELGAGAALALWSRMREERRSARPVVAAVWPMALRWSGLAAIAATALTFSSATPFPGYMALLPVLGSVAVIAAGEAGPRDPLSHVVHVPPVQTLGGISYSLYLWHWPGIVILPFVLHRDPEATEKLFLLAICLGLAWLTKELVEDPARKWRLLVRPGLTAVATVAAMLVVAASSGAIQHRVQQEEDAALARLASAQSDPCFGAGAMRPGGAGCADPFRSPEQPTVPASDSAWSPVKGCVESERPAPMEPLLTCRFSDQPPTRTVAIVGDSHALHYRAAVHEIAKQLNWQVVEIYKIRCPATHAPVLQVRDEVLDEGTIQDCRSWADRVDDELDRVKPAYVFASGFVRATKFDDDPARSIEIGAQGFVDVWTRWADRGMRVFALDDVPTTGGKDFPDCLAINVTDPLACSEPRAKAVTPDAMTVAAERVASDRIALVDFSDQFCDEARCYGAIGGAVVYMDKDHITSQFARTLAPALLEAIGGGLS
jgi:peptidoglycan/LPS O-acetylase OafA/YrhL